MTAIPPEVRDLAKGIAADIRKYGHYKGRGEYWGPGRPTHPCCIVESPTSERARHGAVSLLPLYRLLVADSADIAYWNDTTPTADVLAALDHIAEGGQG